MTEERMTGQVALVTGAASGIGLACAQRFVAEGATVVGFDLATAPEWSALPGDHPMVEGDVTKPDDLARAIEAAAAVGPIDVLVTAAGVAGGGFIHNLPLTEWQRVIDINLTGTMLPCQAVLPQMIEQRRGSIITVASVEGLEGCEGGSSYNAAKGGVVLLTKNLANDYGRVGIRANAICPGFIDTPMFRSVMDQAHWRDDVEAQHKLGRFGKPEEIAGAAYFLASDDASFVTGVALPVDGGYTAGHSYGIPAMVGLE